MNPAQVRGFATAIFSGFMVGVPRIVRAEYGPSTLRKPISWFCSSALLGSALAAANAEVTLARDDFSDDLTVLRSAPLT